MRPGVGLALVVAPGGSIDLDPIVSNRVVVRPVTKARYHKSSHWFHVVLLCGRMACFLEADLNKTSLTRHLTFADPKIPELARRGEADTEAIPEAGATQTGACVTGVGCSKEITMVGGAQ
jgi:hypothetical protein